MKVGYNKRTFLKKVICKKSLGTIALKYVLIKGKKVSILEPISSAKPCGEDCKYDDEYLEVEVEIEKNFNATNESETEWDVVVDKCEKILKDSSKDLKIASFWIYAQWKLNGWNNFFDIFETYAKFIEIYGKEIYPLAGRRKIKIFEWVEKVFEEATDKVIMF